MVRYPEATLSLDDIDGLTMTEIIRATMDAVGPARTHWQERAWINVNAHRCEDRAELLRFVEATVRVI